MPTWLIGLLLNKYTIALVGGLAMLGGAYFAGYQKAAQSCHEASLRAEIATLKRDAAANEAAADVARVLMKNLGDAKRDLQQKVTNYEVELAKRPDPRCTLDKRDADRLRSIGDK